MQNESSEVRQYRIMEDLSLKLDESIKLANEYLILSPESRQARSVVDSVIAAKNAVEGEKARIGAAVQRWMDSIYGSNSILQGEITCANPKRGYRSRIKMVIMYPNRKVGEAHILHRQFLVACSLLGCEMKDLRTTTPYRVVILNRYEIPFAVITGSECREIVNVV